MASNYEMVKKSENISKRCTKCEEEKLLESFRIRKDGKFGRTSQCRDCLNVYGKQYSQRQEVKKRKKIQGQEWKKNNSERYKLRNKRYYKENKEHIMCYLKERRRLSPQYKLTCILRDRLRRAINGNYKAGSAVKDLGCSVKFLKKYLEHKFYSRSKTREIMNWENHGSKGWHIDHVKPLSSFNLMDRTQFIEACNYTNLQPLWSEDNWHKGGCSL